MPILFPRQFLQPFFYSVVVFLLPPPFLSLFYPFSIIYSIYILFSDSCIVSIHSDCFCHIFFCLKILHHIELGHIFCFTPLKIKNNQQFYTKCSLCVNVCVYIHSHIFCIKSNQTQWWWMINKPRDHHKFQNFEEKKSEQSKARQSKPNKWRGCRRRRRKSNTEWGWFCSISEKGTQHKTLWQLLELPIYIRCDAKKKTKKNSDERKEAQKIKENKINTINVKPNENKYIFYSLLSAIALYLQFDVVCACILKWNGWSCKGFALQWWWLRRRRSLYLILFRFCCHFFFTLFVCIDRKYRLHFRYIFAC